MSASLTVTPSPSSSRINTQHYQEWFASRVDPDIIDLNIQSWDNPQQIYSFLGRKYCPKTIRAVDRGYRVTLKNNSSVWEVLGNTTLQHRMAVVLRRPGGIGTQTTFFSDIKDVLSTGTSDWDPQGGWFCGGGANPLADWQPSDWGCFKPNSPRRLQPKGFSPDQSEKKLKYEHPLGKPASIFCLVVSDPIWDKIAQRCDIPISDQDRVEGFWPWVWKRNAPIVITEGAKKAGCLLTAGYAAVALPGITGAVRTKDAEGNKVPPYLIPEIEVFATASRQISICFDNDSKAKTILDVNREISKLGWLLTQKDCEVKVIQWQGSQKGVDDYIVAHSVEAFEQIYCQALTLEHWQSKQYCQLIYPPALTLNQQYLGNLPIPPEAQLVCLNSPKGTGKTQFLELIAREAIANGQWVLLVGHRVQLVQEICRRIGIPYVAELRQAETGKALGYGLCVDSLHPQSQARFSADGWRDGVVILDESEQVIWHTLNSNTEVQKHRVAVLGELRRLLSNVLSSGRGRVILSDADLSDLSIDFVRGLAGSQVEPWIIHNIWKPEQAWTVYNHKQTNPGGWLAALQTNIRDGGKPFIVTDSQKARSKWSSQTLEKFLSKDFPQHRILRIDSETVSDPTHPAFGCITRLNEILQNYDIVIASPSIETGVSIDLKGHFTGVWGCFQGVIPENSARQALSRVREPLDRHVWVASYGKVGQIGNGSTSINSFLAAEHQLAKLNKHLLQETDVMINSDGEISYSEPTALRVWAKMGCRINYGMLKYRRSIFNGLAGEGHQVVGVSTQEAEALIIVDELVKIKDLNHWDQCEAVAQAEEIAAEKYDRLKQQRSKTPEQRRQERKFLLRERYQVPVTPYLVAKDSQGWYPQLRLHYYLTIGQKYLKARDREAFESVVQGGRVWLPDLNRSQLGPAVAVLDYLGTKTLLDPERESSGADEDLTQMAAKAKEHSWEIKAALAIGISSADSPVAIAQKLLGKLGLHLNQVRRESTPEGKAGRRVYGFLPPNDGRDDVFDAWLQRDTQMEEN